MEPVSANFVGEQVTTVSWPLGVDPTSLSKWTAEAKGIRKEKALQMWRVRTVRKLGHIPKCSSPGCSVTAVFDCELEEYVTQYLSQTTDRWSLYTSYMYIIICVSRLS